MKEQPLPWKQNYTVKQIFRFACLQKITEFNITLHLKYSIICQRLLSNYIEFASVGIDGNKETIQERNSNMDVAIDMGVVIK